jgi:hypothetical protein
LSFFLFLITFSTIIKSQESRTPSTNSTRIVAICGDHDCTYPEDRIVCPEDCDSSYKKNETEINNKINVSIAPLPVFVYAVIIFLILLIILLLIIYKMKRKYTHKVI